MSANIKRVLGIPGIELLDESPCNYIHHPASQRYSRTLQPGLTRTYPKFSPVAGLKVAPQTQEIAVRTGVSAPVLGEINKLLMSIVSSSRYFQDLSRSRYYIPPLTSSMPLKRREPRHCLEPSKPLSYQFNYNSPLKRRIIRATIRHSKHLDDVSKRARDQHQNTNSIRMNRLQMEYNRLGRHREKLVQKSLKELCSKKS